jgi:tetratricopeptide (TPR) repeat protein
MSLKDPIDFEALMPLALRAALTTQRWPDFLRWMKDAIAHFMANPQRHPDPEGLQRALGLVLARSIWNLLPLPRNDFAPDPIAEPGRNEPCPCGSGFKYKQCCAGAPPVVPLDRSTIWFYALQAFKPADRAAALASRHLSRTALADYARERLEEGQVKAVIDLLLPQFEPAVHPRSQLRSDAWQRLACIYMDTSRGAQAWEAFRSAQRDQPNDPALGMLEVQLLMAEGKVDLARERARFHRAQLRRRQSDVSDELLEYLDDLARDPAAAMSKVAMRTEGGAGERLASWIDRVRNRPLPAYEVSAEVPSTEPTETAAGIRKHLQALGVRGDSLESAVQDMVRQLQSMPPPPADELADAETDDSAAHGLFTLQAPKSISLLSSPWHSIFELDKPFSVQHLPFDAGDIWQPDTEQSWCAFIDSHLEAFDSIDILDDLATAAALHPQGNQLWMAERLALPLLERAVAILEAAVDLRPEVELPWGIADHRPALRALFRLAELEAARGHDQRRQQLYELLLRINPGDNHGVRFWLANDYMSRGEISACLKLCSAFSDDPAPELRFNEALAHFRQGSLRSAGLALERAHREVPRLVRFRLPARVRKPPMHEQGVTLDGDDRAWLYREAMRVTWQNTPGALQWVKKALGPAASAR